jgi:diguanylate cyclase (GGDEF)-like protein
MMESLNRNQDGDLPPGSSGMESSAQFLEAIKQATLQVSSSLKQQNILYNILKSSFDLIPDIKDAQIFLIEDGEISCCAEMHSDGSLQLTFPGTTQNEWIRHFIHAEEMAVVQDSGNPATFKDFPKAWTGSVITQPFEIQDSAKGVMVLAFGGDRTLSRDEKFSLSLLKDHASVSLHNAVLHREIEEQALTDSLTGLPNRRSLDDHLQEELRRGRKYQNPFSVMLLDINQFKQVNDHYGHLIGDMLLRQIAEFLKQVIRKTDFIARYGGDEFAIILPETDAAMADKIAARINQVLIDNTFQVNQANAIQLSACLGLTVYPTNGDSIQELLESADRDLYRKKSLLSGRNQAGF